MPPVALQWRAEHRVEQLNERAFGAAWAWLPTPLWLTLVDPESDGAELARFIRLWSARRPRMTPGNGAARRPPVRRNLPVLRQT
jgi:hypothetical protein